MTHMLGHYFQFFKFNNTLIRYSKYPKAIRIIIYKILLFKYKNGLKNNIYGSIMHRIACYLIGDYQCNTSISSLIIETAKLGYLLGHTTGAEECDHSFKTWQYHKISLPVDIPASIEMQLGNNHTINECKLIILGKRIKISYTAKMNHDDSDIKVSNHDGSISFTVNENHIYTEYINLAKNVENMVCEILYRTVLYYFKVTMNSLLEGESN